MKIKPPEKLKPVSRRQCFLTKQHQIVIRDITKHFATIVGFDYSSGYLRLASNGGVEYVGRDFTVNLGHCSQVHNIRYWELLDMFVHHGKIIAVLFDCWNDGYKRSKIKPFP